MALFLSFLIIDKTFYIEEFLVSSWRIMIVLRLLSIFLGSPYLWFWICGWPVRRLTWWWAIYHCTDSAIGQEASWTVIQGFIKSSLPFSILVSDISGQLQSVCHKMITAGVGPQPQSMFLPTCRIMFEKCENIGWFQISSTLSVVIRFRHQCKGQRVKIPVPGSIAMQSR